MKKTMSKSSSAPLSCASTGKVASMIGAPPRRPTQLIRIFSCGVKRLLSKVRWIASGRAAADTYSARPGHSEHQTGLAFDLNRAASSFEGTPAALWIEAHCAQYGFIVRFPKGKEAFTGFIYEPWHVRYVGQPLAQELTDSGLCLEEYYGLTSEYQE